MKAVTTELDVVKWKMRKMKRMKKSFVDQMTLVVRVKRMNKREEKFDSEILLL